MARKRSPSRKATRPVPRTRGLLRRVVRLVLRGAVGLVVLALLWIALLRWVNPPTTPYIVAEAGRFGAVERAWVPMERIAPVMARAAVAAEDADFCLHWGFDVEAIRSAIETGTNRGASTITQQTVKNVFLWHGRSWGRKALEAAITPAVELFWPKRRILEVYLNVAEFDRGVFGVEAAARHYFGVDAAGLSAAQAAALASILPAPKDRNAAALSPALRRKARRVADGAATIRADGRAACFQD